MQKADLESETLREETAEELALVVSPQTKRAPSPLLGAHPGPAPLLVSYPGSGPAPLLVAHPGPSLLLSVSPTDESLLLPGDRDTTPGEHEDSSVSLGERAVILMECRSRVYILHRKSYSPTLFRKSYVFPPQQIKF